MNAAAPTSAVATVRRLSAAALDRWRTCPKQFFLVDVERRRRKDAPSAQLVVANAVHHALERLFGLDTRLRTPETAERALRCVWAEHRLPRAFGSREEEAHAGAEAIAMLRRFAERADLTVTPLVREQWLDTRLPNGVTLFGKLDRVDASRSGDGIELVDYKTGRRRLEDDELASDSAVLVYTALAEAAFDRPVERVRLIYLALDEEANWRPEREDVEARLAELGRLVERAVASVDYPAYPGSHCRWCPFALECRERHHVEITDLVPVEDLPF